MTDNAGCCMFRGSMTFEEIENVLGKAVVDAVQAAIAHAFIAARNSPGERGDAALQSLMIAMLGSVVRPEKDELEAQELIIRLKRAVDGDF